MGDEGGVPAVARINLGLRMLGGVFGGAAGAAGGSRLRAEGRAGNRDGNLDNDRIRRRGRRCFQRWGRWRRKGCTGKIPAEEEFSIRNKKFASGCAREFDAD